MTTARARVFAMVTTQHSSEYTNHALRSFFQHTELSAGDRFMLIDNDISYDPRIWERFPIVERIKNQQPKSFAENVNQAIDVAGELKADLFFLNNDIIFTPGWLSPLLLDAPVILSPMGNQQVQYKTDSLVWKNALSLETYLKHSQEFDMLIKSRADTPVEYHKVLNLGFFCVKLPFSVYSVVGSFHTGFGIGGAEDTDYCLRAILKGFSVQFALSSFVLHFNQRSTGAVEDLKAKSAREQQYYSVFEDRWGDQLSRLALLQDQSVIDINKLQEVAKKKQYHLIIRKLLEQEGLSPPGAS